MTQRHRIVLLVPSSNTIMDLEFYAKAPKGVTIHTAMMRLTEVTPARRDFGLLDNLRIGPGPQRDTGEHHTVGAAEADAVFISYTKLPIAALIEELEKEFNGPMVASN